MHSLKLNKSYILPILFIAISLVCILMDFFNLSIVASLFVLLRIQYLSRKKFAEDSNIIANPILLLIPIFVFTQTLYWLIYLCVENNITFFNYTWEIPYMIDIKKLPQSFAPFIFLSTIYLLALSISYNYNKIVNTKSKNFELSNKNSLYLLLSFLVIISTLYYIFGDRIYIPPGPAHILKILAKLRVVFSSLIIFHLLNKKSLSAKLSLIVFISIYISLGFLSVMVLTMRMILFEPLIIILVIFFINRNNYKLSLSKFLKIGLFAAMCILLFSIATSLKFIEQVDKTSYLTIPQKIIHTVDVFASRSAAYFSDIIANSNPASKKLFETKKEYIFVEITNGLPLGSIFVSKQPKYSFDMEFFWTYNPVGISSTYVSAPSAMFFTIGLLPSMLILFIVGFGQGLLFKYYTYQLGNNISWLLIHPILIPFYLNGLAKTDLLGMLAYSFIAYLILRYLILSNNRSMDENIACS